LEVLTGVAALHEFVCYSSHKAGNDFSVVPKDLKARIKKIVYKFRKRSKADGDAVVEEFCYAMK
jgi:hypothetical protein